MKNHISITREPEEKKKRPVSFQKRFLTPVKNPSWKSSEVIRQNNQATLIPEWQLMDYESDELQKQKESNLYIADWQMIG